MNRDGFRVTWAAGHEAAHGVIALMSGLDLDMLSIAPPKADRGSWWAACFAFPPAPGWPVPMTPTADADTDAAGWVWDLLNGVPLRQAWHGCGGDRANVGSAVAWFRAAARTAVLLRRPAVAAAVRDVEAKLLSCRSGDLAGWHVQRICWQHGLIPYPEMWSPEAGMPSPADLWGHAVPGT